MQALEGYLAEKLQRLNLDAFIVNCSYLTGPCIFSADVVSVWLRHRVSVTFQVNTDVFR